MITYRVDSNDLKRVTRALTKLKNSTPSNLRNAINRAATRVRREIIGEAKAGYTLKGLKLASVDLFRATPSLLVATLKAQGRPRQLKEYKSSAPKSGVRAAVVKGAGKTVKGDSEAGAAFIATGGRVAGMIVQRTSRKRYPLKVLHADSIPKIVEMVFEGKGDSGQAAVEPKARQILYEEIQKEIAKLTAK